jgi:hypothetical protein
MQALLLVAEHDGPTMFARIGVMRALNRHVERVLNPDRKDQHWTPEAGAGSMTEARNYRGFDPDGVAETEADHFGNCPVCGAYLDMRDLGRWRIDPKRNKAPEHSTRRPVIVALRGG